MSLGWEAKRKIQFSNVRLNLRSQYVRAGQLVTILKSCCNVFFFSRKKQSTNRFQLR